MKLARILACAAAIAVAFAAPSHADPNDSAFLQRLARKGIVDDFDALTVAHDVCFLAGRGHIPSDITGFVTAHSDLDDDYAAYFVGAAISTYCPEDG